MDKSVFVFTGEALGHYGFGKGHPFGPDRQQAFIDELNRQGLASRVVCRAPQSASEADLLTFHTPEYIKHVRSLSIFGHGYLDAGNTPVFNGMYEAACTVVGTTLAAVGVLMTGECQRAFVPIAGLHHARRDAAEGFCVFNDCGVAIEALRKNWGIRRIAYVDIDAHHGDGVYFSFVDDPNLFIVDSHEDGRYLYPGTGAVSESGTGLAKGTKLNVPLEPLTNDAEFAKHWPAMEAFLDKAQPEFIILQCGADSLAGDPLTHLQLTQQTHAFVTKRLCELADKYSHGRLLVLGGGGYNRTNLAQAWCAVVEVLLTD